MDGQPELELIDLRDGSRLGLIPVKGSETFTVQMTVSVGNGYCNGPEDFEIAHLVEHMFSFLTSLKHPSAQKNEGLFSSMGIRNNATTNDFCTKFYYRGESNSILFRLLSMLMDAYTDFKLDPKIIEKEKQSVMNELSQQRSDPSYVMTEGLDQYLYRNHPRSQYTLEKAKQACLATTPEQIMTFWKTLYHGSNVLFLVSGKFDINRARRFFHLRVLVRDCSPPPQLKPPVFAEMDSDIVLKYHLEATETNHIHIRWMTTEIPHLSIDYYTLYFIDMVMTSTLVSRLYKRLRMDMGMIYGIESVRFADESDHTVYGFKTSVFKKQYIQPVIQEIEKQCKRLTKSLLTLTEMRSIKNQISMAFMTDNEKRLQPSFWINEYHDCVRNHRPIITRARLLRHYMTLTPNDLRNLAKKVFHGKTIIQIGYKKKQAPV